MNRRAFVKILGFSTLFNFTFCKKINSIAGKGKVIIVGAGMSGLSAARMIADAGWDVVVVEAKDRIGGRVWTDNSLGTPLDMGASWIEEATGNPMTSLANEYGLKTIETNWDSINLYNSDGSMISSTEAARIDSEFQLLFGKASEYAETLNKDISVEDALKYVLRNEILSREEQKILDWGLASEELDGAIEFDKLSAWGDTEAGFSGGDFLFPDGYGQIAGNLAKGLNIKMNHPVELIEYNDTGVKVHSGGKVFEGDYAIVTLPLGVLKTGSVKFSPELPDYKLNAVSRLDMGNLNKVAIKFPEIFWSSDKHFIGYISEIKREFPVFINWAYYTKKPYLLATIGNSFSREFYKLNEAGQKEKIYKILSKIFPNAIMPEAIKFSGWFADQFAGGSYSYLPVGVTGNEYDALAKSIGRLRFAGEATIRGYSSTVHGAYLSGQREAKNILGGN